MYVTSPIGRKRALFITPPPMHAEESVTRTVTSRRASSSEKGVGGRGRVGGEYESSPTLLDSLEARGFSG
jgi:hypothetical protein